MWSECSCAFPKNGTATGSRESARAMASTARQKRSYLHHQGEFQLQNCTVGTVHDSDHEGVVRIFVGHSYHSNGLFILYYIISRGNRTPGSRVATGCNSTVAQARYYCNSLVPRPSRGTREGLGTRLLLQRIPINAHAT